MINFANDLDYDFALWLRAEKAHTLTTMQEAVIGVQSNLMASNKLKMKEEKAEKDKKQMKEEKPSFFQVSFSRRKF